MVVIWRYLPIRKKYRHNNIIKHAIIAKMKKIFNSEKEEDRISFAENK